jgi:hypothetical protein
MPTGDPHMPDYIRVTKDLYQEYKRRSDRSDSEPVEDDGYDEYDNNDNHEEDDNNNGNNNSGAKGLDDNGEEEEEEDDDDELVNFFDTEFISLPTQANGCNLTTPQPSSNAR